MTNTKPDPRIAKAQALAAKANEDYGHLAGWTGHNQIKLRAVPSGSLMYDFQSGIGGHPMGQFVEVFGAPEIGKTTIMGGGALRNAQGMGMLTGVIALEPNIDEDWMIEHGVNLDYNVIARPDNGEEAFGLLHDWVYSGAVDYILFDSIGALSSAKANDSDKAQAFGESALITWGVKRVLARAWKNDVGVMFINQQRDDTKSRISGLVDSPGGHGFKHCMTVRTHIKPGKDRYTVKMDDGGDKKIDVMIGRQYVCNFKKHKAAESSGKGARFDFYFKHVEGYPFGFDVAADVINTAKVAGVFEGSGWLKHRTFPGGKLNGKAAVAEFLANKPEALVEIRNDVMAEMLKRKRHAEKTKPQLEVVGG